MWSLTYDHVMDHVTDHVKYLKNITSMDARKKCARKGYGRRKLENVFKSKLTPRPIVTVRKSTRKCQSSLEVS